MVKVEIFNFIFISHKNFSFAESSLYTSNLYPVHTYTIRPAFPNLGYISTIQIHSNGFIDQLEWNS